MTVQAERALDKTVASVPCFSSLEMQTIISSRDNLLKELSESVVKQTEAENKLLKLASQHEELLASELKLKSDLELSEQALSQLMNELEETKSNCVVLRMERDSWQTRANMSESERRAAKMEVQTSMLTASKLREELESEKVASSTSCLEVIELQTSLNLCKEVESGLRQDLAREIEAHHKTQHQLNISSKEKEEKSKTMEDMRMKLDQISVELNDLRKEKNIISETFRNFQEESNQQIIILNNEINKQKESNFHESNQIEATTNSNQYMEEELLVLKTELSSISLRNNLLNTENSELRDSLKRSKESQSQLQSRLHSIERDWKEAVEKAVTSENEKELLAVELSMLALSKDRLEEELANARDLILQSKLAVDAEHTVLMQQLRASLEERTCQHEAAELRAEDLKKELLELKIHVAAAESRSAIVYSELERTRADIEQLCDAMASKELQCQDAELRTMELRKALEECNLLLESAIAREEVVRQELGNKIHLMALVERRESEKDKDLEDMKAYLEHMKVRLEGKELEVIQISKELEIKANGYESIEQRLKDLTVELEAMTRKTENMDLQSELQTPQRESVDDTCNTHHAEKSEQEHILASDEEICGSENDQNVTCLRCRDVVSPQLPALDSQVIVRDIETAKQIVSGAGRLLSQLSQGLSQTIDTTSEWSVANNNKELRKKLDELCSEMKIDDDVVEEMVEFNGLDDMTSDYSDDDSYSVSQLKELLLQRYHEAMRSCRVELDIIGQSVTKFISEQQASIRYVTRYLILYLLLQ